MTAVKMADLLGDASTVQKDNLYRGLDKMLAHRRNC